MVAGVARDVVLRGSITGDGETGRLQIRCRHPTIGPGTQSIPPCAFGDANTRFSLILIKWAQQALCYNFALSH